MIELGVVVAPDEKVGFLARHAETRGLDLVVVGGEGVLDVWTAAVWATGSTELIQVGVEPVVEEPWCRALVAEERAERASRSTQARTSTGGKASTGGDASTGGSASTDSRGGGASTVGEEQLPLVAARAGESLDALAPGRVLVGPDAWVHAEAGSDEVTLRALASRDLPVVVPVTTREEIDRLATIFGLDAVPRTRRRSSAVRARRRSGIDYDGVPASLAATAVEPGDPGYRAVSSTYLRAGSPGLVLRPRTPDEVAEAIAFARRHTHLPLGIRSAGHGVSGRSTNDGGLVIDVGALREIEMSDERRGVVRLGPGATWKQVAAALAPYGLGISSGDYGGVGVGGIATAGGVGLLGREQGLTIDRVRAVELVLADGTRVRATGTEHPDLFWAVRGAGANFGIVTAVEVEAAPVGEVGWAQLTVVATDLEEALLRYAKVQQDAPRDTTVFLVTGRPQRGQSVLQLYGVVHQSEPEVVVDRLTPFAEIGVLVDHRVVITPYAGVMAAASDVGDDGHQGYGEPITRSGFVSDFTDAFAREVTILLESGAVRFFQLRAMGGAVADTPRDAMAFAHRDATFQVTAMGSNDQRLERAWAPLREHLDGLYLSFESSRSPERLRDAFPPDVLTRLRETKRAYDPQNLFRDNFNVDPSVSEEITS